MELAAIFFNIFIFNMLAWSYISSSLEFNRAQVCDGVGLFWSWLNALTYVNSPVNPQVWQLWVLLILSKSICLPNAQQVPELSLTSQKIVWKSIGNWLMLFFANVINIFIVMWVDGCFGNTLVFAELLSCVQLSRANILISCQLFRTLMGNNQITVYTWTLIILSFFPRTAWSGRTWWTTRWTWRWWSPPLIHHSIFHLE